MGDETGIDGKALDQNLACLRGRLRERVERGPWPLGIDVVGRDRRHPAPVVDPRCDKTFERAGLQVGRRLDVHGAAEHDARDRHGPKMLRQLRLGVGGHARTFLGAEILDNDLLQVAVAAMKLAQMQQRLDALPPRLADADQDARGERHRRFAGGGDGCEPYRRRLVGRAEMRPPAAGETLGCGFEHQPL
jgi:hypothetical protein